MGIVSALRERRIRQLGLPPFVAVDASTGVGETIQTMQSAKLGAVLVTENDRLVGIFTERDYLRRIAVEGRRSRDTFVRDVMSAPVIWERYRP